MKAQSKLKLILSHSLMLRALAQTLRNILVLGIGLSPVGVMTQTVREYPPALPSVFADVPLNGGRVQSIAVNPTNNNEIIAAHQFGGLWKTVNGGRRWFHLQGLYAVFVVDVVYSRDGRTVIATVARDTKTANGGGIWVSRDGGMSWNKPADGSGNVPTTVSGLTRTSAYGISYAPDDPNRIYVGTDYGIAMSINDGATWSHRLLEPTGHEVRSVQALPGNRAVAVGFLPGEPYPVRPAVIYLKDPTADNWREIRRGSFSDGFKNIDVSPYDNDKVFILQDYDTLLLYEVASNRWTVIPLPGGGSRGPFIRASRGVTGPPAIDLWAGLGVGLRRASCRDFDGVRRLAATDWQQIGRAEGLHDDCGYLALDAQKRPVMFGSDGGLFKPQNSEAIRWTLAAPPGSEMNSYQITSLAGTNFNFIAQPLPSLYFTTQDNGIWASSDGGRTWPNNDCAEGWHIQTWHLTSTPRDLAARVGYGRTGCGTTAVRYSDANLVNQRDILNTDRTGRRFRGMPFSAFVLSPGNWMRFVDGRYTSMGRSFGSMNLYLSTDNLERWQQIGTTILNPSGGIFKSSGPLVTPTTYTAFQGTRTAPDGSPIIALARIDDVLRVRPGEIIEDNLIYLPSNGSLGLRATEFDWHPVYGIDPQNPDFIIAPDVVNGTVWYSIRRGATLNWTPDDELTDRVTQGGRLLLYDDHPYRMQVTNIAFSPYERNLIMIGTREAGVIYSDDRGNTWHTIPGSEAMLYVTGFFFTPGNTVYAATYGRGLWQIDMRRRDRRPFPVFPICGFSHQDCIVRLPPDPSQNVIRDFPWKDYNVLVVFGGRVNGIIRSGEDIKSITLTPNSLYRFYAVDDQAMPKITENKDSAGFKNDPVAEFALKNQEVITGVILKGSRFVGYLTNQAEFKAEQEPIAQKAGKEVSPDKPGSGLPYLSISTDSPLGPGLVQTGGVVSLYGSSFSQGIPVEVRLNGKTLAQLNTDIKGNFTYTIKVNDELSMGQHRLEAIQKTQQSERRAVTTFIKVRKEDRIAK